VSKYDYGYHSPDSYCYPNTSVLINKLNITDGATLHEAERRITALRLAELMDTPVRGRFGFTHLKAIHRAIFSDIYAWAGEIRTGEFLTKGNTIFCLGRHIPSYADNLFAKLKERFEEIVDDLGLNMASAITVFVKTVVREERIPFELSRKKDSFYSLANRAALKESIEQDRRGEVITFDSVAELETAAFKTIEEKKKVQGKDAR
jgi:addiction module RelB/DinJ family antitoxin